MKDAGKRKRNVSDPKEAYERVYGKILGLLSLSPRSQRELDTGLDKYLSKENVSEEQKDTIKSSIVEVLSKNGHYDDENFVKSFLESMMLSSKPRSRTQMMMKLRSKGVDPDIIRSHLDNTDQSDELIFVKKLIEKKIRSMKRPLSFRDKMALMRYMASKGYDHELVRGVVDSIDGVK